MKPATLVTLLATLAAAAAADTPFLWGGGK
jgi:hypothetical protein